MEELIKIIQLKEEFKIKTEKMLAAMLSLQF